MSPDRFDRVMGSGRGNDRDPPAGAWWRGLTSPVAAFLDEMYSETGGRAWVGLFPSEDEDDWCLLVAGHRDEQGAKAYYHAGALWQLTDADVERLLHAAPPTQATPGFVRTDESVWGTWLDGAPVG